MSILLLEDSIVSQLNPVTTARPAFGVTAGSYTLLDLVRTTQQPLVAQVRRYLRPICELDYGPLKLAGDSTLPQEESPTLILNARMVPSVDTLKTIEQLLALGADTSGVVWHEDQVAAIVRPQMNWQAIGEAASSNVDVLAEQASQLDRLDYKLSLMSYPHEVVAANMDVIQSNLQYRIESGHYEQRTDGVFVAKGAKLGEYVLTETDDGPIVIDEDASIGPYTLLRGPIYVGPRCRVLEHAAIKDAVSLGHTTKIGGEVEAAVVEPFTNKQHHGFLGHSYLGSWINLGAGTCNSDLKNTYGKVNMEYPAGKAATGMQFLGCVMGDYSKSAINTGIFTGKVIGVCSMMYGFVTSNVPSYVNYARLFGQLATLPPEVMIATQQRMFSRRKVEQRPCDMQLLHDMYRVTQHERDKIGDDLTF